MKWTLLEINIYIFMIINIGDSTTLTTTVNHETTLMTASENTVKNQATTVGKTIMNCNT